MQMISLLGFYPLYLLIGLVLDKPYMMLPNHHHFGVWSWWGYFDTPVQSIPKNVVTGNQGWFRIYLHHFFLVFFKVFGKEHHLLKLRLFNTAYNALTASAIHLVAVQAGFGTAQALASAVVFLYLISRPQMTSYFVNAEPFAVLFTTLALGALLASQQALSADPASAALWFFAFSFLYALTTFLNKLNHAVEYGIIFVVYCLVTRFFSLWLTAGLAGWAVAACVFYLCFRRYLHKEGAVCFFNYLKIASAMDLSVLIAHHKTYLLPVLTSCGSFLFAAVLGMDLFGQTGAPAQIISIFFAASLVGLGIQRTFLFHHWIAVLPFVALCAGQFLFSIPALPGAWSYAAAAVVLIPLLLRLPWDLKSYTFKDPYALGRHIFGQDAWRFFDPLCPRAAALSQTEPFAAARVMFWSIHVQLYVLTKRVPVCMEQPFCAASVYLFNPNYDELLIESLPKDRPRFIFDLNALGPVSHYGYFAPLLMYLRTGWKYRPCLQQGGILVYELDSVSAPVMPLARFPLMTEVGSQERTLIWENFRHLFHVLPGNDAQLIGLRLLVSGSHLFEFVEEAMRRHADSPLILPAAFAARPLEHCSLRLQVLSWLAPEAVAAVPEPNALPLYLALMSYSVGNTKLARRYEEMIDPEFELQCAPLSLGFSLGLAYLRWRANPDQDFEFPQDQALYFSERPLNVVALLRLIYTYLSTQTLPKQMLDRIEWIGDSLYIETDIPSPADVKNRLCLEETRTLLAAKRKAHPA